MFPVLPNGFGRGPRCPSIADVPQIDDRLVMRDHRLFGNQPVEEHKRHRLIAYIFTRSHLARRAVLLQHAKSLCRELDQIA